MRALGWLAGVVLAAGLVVAAPVSAASKAPTIASFTPTRGAVSAVVKITGTNFVDGSTTVDFHGTTADTPTVSSSKSLTVAVPAGATTGSIGVTTPSGTAHSHASFTVADPPTVTSINPASGKIGAAVKISGTSFTGAKSVTFNGTPASFSVTSATAIKATVPKGATTGPVSVSIPGASGASGSDFVVLFPPSVSSFTPAYGAVGDTVTIDGADFTDNTVVKFNGRAADITDGSPTELQVTVPSGAKTGKITLANSIGSGTSATSFTVEGKPAVTSFAPTSGKSGTLVTITGRGFLEASYVAFAGNAAASFSVVSDTKITATVGPNAEKGVVSVTSDQGTGSSSAKFAGSPFVLKAEITGSLDATDPAISYFLAGWQVEYSECLQLLQYADVAGQGGTQLQPDAAESLPLISEDGLTYTFAIRDGLAFPNGEQVTAETFKHAIERSLAPSMNGPASLFASDIAGAQDYINGDAGSISGVDANDMTLTITLTKNDPDFIARIAMPFFCAVPLDTPDTQQNGPIPMAGPYTIEAIDNGTIKLVRNLNYGGTRPAVPDEIDVVQNANSSTLLKDVLSNKAGYTNSLYGNDQVTALSKYPKQTTKNAVNGIRYLALNTSRDAFSDPKARQAVNLVINRTAIDKLYGASAEPTDQYLTPSMPGYTAADIYPLNGPSSAQLSQARTLATESGLYGSTIEYWTCQTATCTSITNLLKEELAQINVTLHVTTFSGYGLYTSAGTLGAAYDMVGVLGWVNDFPDPSDTLNVLLDGTTIQDSNNLNLAYFDDPTYNQKLADAEADFGSDRYSNYGALDVDIATNQAPLAALSTLDQIDFFSTQIGCRIYQPIYGTDYGALCPH